MTAQDTKTATADPSFIPSVAPLVPYVAVSVGLFVLRNAWAAFLLYQAGMIIVLSVARQWGRVPLLMRSRSVPLLLVAAATALGGVALYALAPILGLTDDIATTCASLGLSGSAWLPFTIFIGLTNPWLEEVYWRGYLGSDSRGLHLNDAWFGGYHVLILAPFVAWWWLATAFVLLTGVAWTWRQSVGLSGGVLVAAVSHCAADVSILLAVWALAVR